MTSQVFLVLKFFVIFLVLAIWTKCHGKGMNNENMALKLFFSFEIRKKYWTEEIA